MAVSVHNFSTTWTGNPTIFGVLDPILLPKGWTKPFSNSNTAVYRAPSGRRRFLRVHEPTMGRVHLRLFDSMSDATDNGTNPTPTQAQQPLGGWFFYNSSTNGSTPISGVVVAGDTAFYLAVPWGAGRQNTIFVGDYIAEDPSKNPYNSCVLARYGSTYNQDDGHRFARILGTDGRWGCGDVVLGLAGSRSIQLSAAFAQPLAAVTGSDMTFGETKNTGTTDSILAGKVRMMPIQVLDANSNYLGVLPGAYNPTSRVAVGDTFNLESDPNRSFLVLNASNVGGSIRTGRIVVETTASQTW